MDQGRKKREKRVSDRPSTEGRRSKVKGQNHYDFSLWIFDLKHETAHYGEIRKIEVVIQDFEVACRLVVGTNRIASVMTRMARLCAEHLPLRLIRPPFAIPKVSHCLQWHRYQDQDPGHM